MYRLSTPNGWLITLMMTVFLTLSQFAAAEDTEIFTNAVPPAASNMLIILDNSGSMNTLIDGTSKTRLESLSDAMKAFTRAPEIEDINLGLMEFSNGAFDPRPHGVSVPVSPIDDDIMPIMLSNLIPTSLSTGSNFGYFDLSKDNLPDPDVTDTVRDFIPKVVDSWKADGGTPIVDSLHEAALYYKGLSPKWGAVSAERVNAAHPSTYTGQILSTAVSSSTGGTAICNQPNCGNSCVPIIEPGRCPVGQSSCGTGNNCTTEVKRIRERCTLGSEAACLAQNPQYDSCEQIAGSSCTTKCNGPRDPETGYCKNEVKTCKDTGFLRCEYQAQITICDRQKYQCSQVKINKVSTGSAIYNSPITQRCQNNALILLTDGAPNVSGQQVAANETRDQIRNLVGSATDCAPVAGQVIPTTIDNTLADGRCGAELVRHMATTDQSSTVDGVNTVRTYTIGFAIDNRPDAKAYLQSLASNGGGAYFTANSSSALVDAFKSIAKDTAPSDRSFAAPVYTVDPASALSHSNDIYLPLFKNSDMPGWSGNLKKFKLNSAGTIVDAKNMPVFDDTGRLMPGAMDYWMPAGTTLANGADIITSGGVANNLVPASRRLLTQKGSSLALVDLDEANVSNAQLGSANDAEKRQFLKYIQGYAPDGSSRKAIGDILHSKPTVVSYGNREVIFFGTNEGFLHAFDAADASNGGGNELFAFMPSSLLKNIPGLYKNEPLPNGGLKRIYGVDGNITVHIMDKNGNGKVDSADNDKATLIFGLRRGGNQYFALDITNPKAPRLKWQFSNRDLGETWSQAKPVKIRYRKAGSIVATDALIFGGGYDNRLDEQTRASRTDLSYATGNSVYIIDLHTGETIWSHRGYPLQHSVPGNISSLDINRDGSVDRLYFGDTGGNIWRVDLNANRERRGRKRYDINNNAQLFHFADLGGSGADYRKFFSAPDVSVFKRKSRERLVISIGSGYRSHPLNTGIVDRFYVINDEDLRRAPPPTKATLTDADLIPVTALNGKGFLPKHKGWYKDLTNDSGEKALTSPMTFNGKVLFTTFAVATQQSNRVDAQGCPIPTPNVARAYALDLLTGGHTADIDGNNTLDKDDESVIVPNGGILDTPQLFFNKPDNCTDDGCDHNIDIRVGKKSTPLIGKDTVGGNNNLGDYLPKVFWLGN